MKKMVVTITALIVLTTGAFGEVRTWTQASTGRKIEGEFIKMKDEKTALIKIGSAEKAIPIAMLSEEDRKFITEQTAPAPAEKKAPKPGKAAPLPTGETTVVISKTHICCEECEKTAIDSVNEERRLKFVDKSAITIVPNKKEQTITVTGPNGKEVAMALKGLTYAGFYGESDHPVLKIKDIAPDEYKTSTMNIHLIYVCCRKREKVIKKAVESVEGVEKTTVKEGARRFIVTGEDFKPTAVMQALRDVGVGGIYQ